MSLFHSSVLLSIFLAIPVSLSSSPDSVFPNKCNETCGSLVIPLPFHLNASCGLPLNYTSPFRLSCINSTTLLLILGSQALRVLDILSDAVVIDFFSATSCHNYSNLNFFPTDSSNFYGVSQDNLLKLYGCDDSSVCRFDCDDFEFNGCGRDAENDSFSCCYSLSDSGIWEPGDALSVFTAYGGCRGFSSWVVAAGTSSADFGLKLEWALPRQRASPFCAPHAGIINASSVKGGARCSCHSGYIGDAFADGFGCRKSCIRNHQLTYEEDCHVRNHNKRRMYILLAGVLGSVLVLAAAMALCCVLLKCRKKQSKWESAAVSFTNTSQFHRAGKTRLFSYDELEEATKDFDESLKFVFGREGAAHVGVLEDGSLVAIQKIQCENEQDLVCLLTRIESLSGISHKNITCLLGCCIELSNVIYVVYEYFPNGTLEDYLLQIGGKSLDWNQRLNIAAETATVLAYLKNDVFPPICHLDLMSSDIFLDYDYSVKLGGVWRLKPNCDEGFSSYQQLMGRNEVYSFGVVLLEMLTGSKHEDPPAMVLTKIRDGRLNEVVDPVLSYGDQPFQKGQMEKVADLAIRCLSFSGGDGKMVMKEVAKELALICKLNAETRKKGSDLEETFSSSSLLQMISMSPDSIYVT